MPDIQKTAWTKSDIASDVAMWTVADVGITGILGALGVGSAGATGVAGVSAALTGLGPIGWGVLVALGIGAGVYAATRQADDNIEDLIDRIEALDYEGTNVESAVRHWLERLNSSRGIMQYQSAAGADQEQKAKLALVRIGELMSLKAFMDDMWSADWPKIKPALGDWGTDPSDFEYAFKTTYGRLAKMIESINAESKKAATKILSERPQMINPLMDEIADLVVKITSTWAAPEFTPEEKKILSIGSQMRAGQAKSIEQIKTTISKLNILRNDLKALLQEAKKRQKTAAAENKLEKVSVTLPDKPTAPKIAPTIPVRKRRKVVRSPAAEKLQTIIKRISVARNIEIGELKVDGIYGPITAKALATVIQSSPELTATFKGFAMTPQMALDVRLMNSYRGGFIDLARRILEKALTEKLVAPPLPPSPPGAPKPPPTPTPTPTPTGKCNRFKINPTPDEIIACLKELPIYVGGSRVYAYDYMRTLGYSDSNMIGMIQRMYPGSPSKVWSADMIARRIGTRYGG
jgi:prefoldin subunit 5